jgi:catechol 2,3-dioxygenase-like lactoylglutathione lyase family enzyme
MRPHVSINVRNLKNSVDFYSKVFGVKPQKQSESYAKFDLKSPALNFAMHEVGEGRNKSQVNHFGIEVDSVDDVESWLKKVESQNLPTLKEEAANCCYAKQDKFWFEDPDGNSWEVFFVHEQLPVIGAEPPKVVAKVNSCGTKTNCC